MAPAELRSLWPSALAARIDGGKVRAIHIPFKKAALMDAIGQFDHKNPPNSALSYYTRETYQGWGLI
jgi:hypothetical protein